jgi:hypothetical protein
VNRALWRPAFVVGAIATTWDSVAEATEKCPKGTTAYPGVGLGVFLFAVIASIVIAVRGFRKLRNSTSRSRGVGLALHLAVAAMMLFWGGVALIYFVFVKCFPSL